MISKEERQQNHDFIKRCAVNVLSELQAVDSTREAIVRRTNGREFPLARIRMSCDFVVQFDLGLLPENDLTTLRDHLRQMEDTLRAARSVATGQFQTSDHSLANMLDSVDQSSAAVFRVVGVVLPFWMFASTKFKELEDEVTKRKAAIDQLYDQTKNEMTKKLGEIEDAVRPLNDAIQRSAIGVHAVHFENARVEHEKAARRWLWYTLIAVVLTLGAALVLVRLGFDGVPKENVLALAITKGVFVSILLTATLWCGRVYKAHIHNMVVNRHRKDALNTYLAFSQNEMSPAVRDAALLAVTQCIFAHQQSGYDDGPTDKDSGRVVDVARALSGK